ncbi:transporter [Salimicrobium jeotgali]|uniref:Energy-coupling factor transporter transmembrane protein EcfT n=2 Tax=Salimicrobium TaxID=351195 RepID=K2FH19_9BACI|nr:MULTISPECIES: energy-coupling factor transporter transmembrane protein EcfT [Salimicrobium]AKG05564.1 transporter [Salimicrobium jeotgali]EKE30441.1 cobalt/nickel ABC transporter permease [Salimicrobium jeotgali]MBM7696584.1 energy-coupling factor transport system permease protein [Salimicrobium jeotgali]SIS93245.1 energy-coupling factor transport system permease protein [Salimicrobium salexigens]
MNNSMIIGQYVPGTSLIHRLDPRTKILVIFFFVIIVFFANSVWSYSILTAFAIGTALATRVPLSFIVKGLKPVWFLIVFTFLLHLFVSRQGDILFSVLGFPFYEESLIQGGTLSLRFFLLILFTSLLTLTTSPIEITDAIEYLLHPLKKLRFPVHELALMMSISLRFIPTLMQEAEKISKAQASRGVDFRTGSLKDRMSAVIPLLIPLFVSAFKRAEELAMAMEARGYQGGEGRTKIRALLFRKKDYIVFFLFCLIMAATIGTRV